VKRGTGEIVGISGLLMNDFKHILSCKCLTDVEVYLLKFDTIKKLMNSKKELKDLLVK
jgi:CRP-like cAMP-binding protein